MSQRKRRKIYGSTAAMNNAKQQRNQDDQKFKQNFMMQKQLQANQTLMHPVPLSLNQLDIFAGNIKHLPKVQDIPEQYQKNRTPAKQIVGTWFYNGLSAQQANSLTPKPGIQKPFAIAAIKAILMSMDCSHEHKMAAATYLLDQWFDVQ